MKKKTLKVLAVLEKFILIAAFAAYAVGAGIFLYINNELINNMFLLAGGYTAMGLLMLEGIILRFTKSAKNKASVRIINFVTALVTVGAALWIIFSQLIYNYFQPLSLFAPPIICFALFMILYSTAVLLGLFAKENTYYVSLMGAAALGVFLITALWAGFQGYGEFNPDVQSQTVIECGEGGYETSRIPSILVIEEGEMQGENKEDILMVFAEARKETALDNSPSEVVYKTSLDAGKTWTEMAVAVSAQDIVDGEGRVADPTPVYDKNTNSICLLFQTGTQEGGFILDPYYMTGKLNSDGSVTWDYDGAVNVKEASGLDFGPGPSKGTQLEDGTLAFPVRADGSSFVVYTSDGGKTWTKGDKSGVGGECDMTVMGDGKLVMISRDGEMSKFPRDNKLRFAISSDNGKTWDQKTTNSTLTTPVVMSSVASYNGRLYAAYAQSPLTRAHLSYSYSDDMGKTWETVSLYSGASGYAVSDITSKGTYYIIAEVGKVEYHEEIRLFKIPLEG